MSKKDLQDLKNLFIQMSKLNMPPCSNNEALEAVAENIIELDAYYAGLALTVAEGGEISMKNLYNIDEIKNKLDQVKVDTLEDKKILEDCSVYLEIIDQINNLLIKLYRK